ncbi:MAG TPA: hypothetical protein VGI70_11595 [Polyangiales bacterium]
MSLTLGVLCAAAAISCEAETGPSASGRMDADKTGVGSHDAGVDAAIDDVPFARVFEILSEQCLPCHASTVDHPNASAKLDLSDESSAYAQMVGALAKGSACNDGNRVLVVANDPDDSLLIQKLENAPDLCGSPMPKTGSAFVPIDAMQIAEIRAWILAGAMND